MTVTGHRAIKRCVILKLKWFSDFIIKIKK